MKFVKDTKGQGAVEYLLIIGGAILIAAVVIAIIANMGRSGKDVTDQAGAGVEAGQTDLNDLMNETLPTE